MPAKTPDVALQSFFVLGHRVMRQRHGRKIVWLILRRMHEQTKMVKSTWECPLSIPNIHWDTDSRVLQKHFTSCLQSLLLIHALTEYAQRMGTTVPHVSVFIFNHNDSGFWG